MRRRIERVVRGWAAVLLSLSLLFAIVYFVLYRVAEGQSCEDRGGAYVDTISGWRCIE